ncbi:FAD-dependent monooxygenase [Arthrobacter sp. GMC3]|uniref:FAD-dependent monooxygenase n=1 Tax=Arthrobacter sp. GMC3 TaxID=2058894 RepID=UPI0015E2AA10
MEFPGGLSLKLFQPNHTAAGVLTIGRASELDRSAPKDLYILSTQEPRGTQEPTAQITWAEMRASIKRVVGMDLPIGDGQWMRSTVGNSRLSEKYRVGRVFLAGEETLRQTRAQAALNATGANAEALRQVLGGAFRARNPHRYLATLLAGRSRPVSRGRGELGPGRSRERCPYAFGVRTFPRRRAKIRSPSSAMPSWW